ncbi:hypothetical protein FQN57_005329 [Myotisia sp. PD_48]|nr:hypothetical protein FQN57_005329 [Myotisia sp. PD_48]
MATSSPRLVTVMGATGAQGGSVVTSLLRNPDLFKVRAITRNPLSERAFALQNRGVEVVKGDGLNKNEMINAFQGSWAVFVNIRSNDPALRTPNGPTEVDCGRIIVEAANECSVEHFLYSSGPPVSQLTNGELSLDMMDSKYKIEQVARNSPNIGHVTVFNAGWYYENLADPQMADFIGGFPFNADDEGYLTLRLPLTGGDERAPFISIQEDYGDLVHGVLLEPEKWAGKLIQGISDMSSFSDLPSIFEKVTGKKARFIPYPAWQDFPTYDIPDLEEFRGMFDFTQRVQGLYFGAEFDVETPRKLKEIVQKSVNKTTALKPLMAVDQYFTTMFGNAEVKSQ